MGNEGTEPAFEFWAFPLFFGGFPNSVIFRKGAIIAPLKNTNKVAHRKKWWVQFK